MNIKTQFQYRLETSRFESIQGLLSPTFTPLCTKLCNQIESLTFKRTQKLNSKYLTITWKPFTVTALYYKWEELEQST